MTEGKVLHYTYTVINDKCHFLTVRFFPPPHPTFFSTGSVRHDIFSRSRDRWLEVESLWMGGNTVAWPETEGGKHYCM